MVLLGNSQRHGFAGPATTKVMLHSLKERKGEREREREREKERERENERVERERERERE